MPITFAIIKERKNPPDRRVVFSPSKLKQAAAQYPDARFIVESSDVRIFPDQAYKDAGFEVLQDVSQADVLIGVKEVPIDALLPNKKYFFFSHTIKKQPYNRDLLKAMLEKNITLYDHEVITDTRGNRLIGFGRYAGLVGAYNGFRALGLKEQTFSLPKAENLADLQALIDQLNTIKLPSIKILLTGTGKVAKGAKEILDAMHIKSVSISEYLTNSFNEPVYCKIDVLDYNKRIDGQVLTNSDFYNNPSAYVSNFMRFARVTDYFIAGHFFGDGSPYLFTREDAKSGHFNIQLVADVSCDIDGPVASTLRASTIADPIYGYDPMTESETDFMNKGAIAVMAVDNLPCELPLDASEDFGNEMLKHVIPYLIKDDPDKIIERATETNKEGQLTNYFNYLQPFVNGEE